MVQLKQDIGVTDPYYEGDSLEIVINVTEDGSEKDLSGASVSWTLIDQLTDTPKLSESDSGVSVSITDSENGEITVTLSSGTTDGLVGHYEHMVRVTDSTGNSSVVTKGQFEISDRATP